MLPFEMQIFRVLTHIHIQNSPFKGDVKAF